MREFEFRAWVYCKEPIKNFMVYSGKSLGDFFDHTMYGLKYTLMQYTGLKDKNGKKIYEGDIIKYKDWFGDEYTWCTTKIMYKEDESQLFPDIWDNFWPPEYDREVIGNVYENPKLMVS